MATARQLDANRRNARRSTGPKTARGKAASAANAVRAGLFAKAVVIPALGETAADLDRYRRRVADDLGAVGPVECDLAGQAAALLWRKRRVLAYEATAALAPADSPAGPAGGPANSTRAGTRHPAAGGTNPSVGPPAGTTTGLPPATIATTR